MNKTWYYWMSALLLMGLTNQPASGQAGIRGLSLGFQLERTSWVIDNDNDFDDDFVDDAQSGGGIGLHVGYGINRVVMLFGHISASAIDADFGDDYGLAHVDLGARFHLGKSNADHRFYLEAALTGIAAETELPLYDVSLSGGGLAIGGGLNYFVSRKLALDINLRVMGGELSEVDYGPIEIDTDWGVASARLGAGLLWFPGR